MDRTQARRTLLGWCAASVGVVVGLQFASTGVLAPPPIHHLAAWLRDRGAVVAGFVALRLVAQALAIYVLSLVVVNAPARLARAARLTAALDRLTAPPLRRVLAAAAGAGLTVALASGPAGAAGAGRTIEMPVMTRLPDPPVPAPSRAPALAAADAAPRSPPPLPPPAPTQAPARREPAAPTVTPVGTWTVRPGDSFWTIAADHVGAVHGRRASEREIGRYWARLVEANRGRLRDRNNPDFLIPGQRFVLPPFA